MYDEKWLIDKLTIAINSIQLTATELVGILYSGGLDSSIVAKLLINQLSQEKVIGFVAGVDKSYDIINAKINATEIGLPLESIYFSEKDIEKVIPLLSSILPTKDIVVLSIYVPLFFALKKVKEMGINYVFVGQGADELFGGYAKYVDIIKKTGYAGFQKAKENDLNLLLTKGLKREKNLANYFQVQLIYPFLNEEIIEANHEMPIDFSITKTESDIYIRKSILRRVASELGLSAKIASQAKKAAQYGSGTMKALRKIAKKKTGNNNPAQLLKVNEE